MTTFSVNVYALLDITSKEVPVFPMAIQLPLVEKIKFIKTVDAPVLKDSTSSDQPVMSALLTQPMICKPFRAFAFQDTLFSTEHAYFPTFPPPLSQFLLLQFAPSTNVS
jgi:hypothetical protein